MAPTHPGWTPGCTGITSGTTHHDLFLLWKNFYSNWVGGEFWVSTLMQPIHGAPPDLTKQRSESESTDVFCVAEIRGAAACSNTRSTWWEAAAFALETQLLVLTGDDCCDLPTISLVTSLTRVKGGLYCVSFTHRFQPQVKAKNKTKTLPQKSKTDTKSFTIFFLLPHKQQGLLQLLPDFKTHLHMQTSSQVRLLALGRHWVILLNMYNLHIWSRKKKSVNNLKSTCSFKVTTQGWNTGDSSMWLCGKTDCVVWTWCSCTHKESAKG